MKVVVVPHSVLSLMDIATKEKNIDECNIREEAMTAITEEKLPAM